MKAIRILLTLMVLGSFTITSKAQTKENQTSTVYSSILQSDKEGVSKKIADIAALLKNNVTVWVRTKDIAISYSLSGTGKDLKVQEDKIAYNNKGEHITLFFSNFMDYQIDYLEDDIQNKGPLIDKILIYSKDAGLGKKLYDDLIYIQNRLFEKYYENPFKLFGPIAAQYRALKVKPTISEEQRKYIVQANLFTQQQDFNKAIEIYNKLIEIDPTTYPAAYLNLALLSAQIKKYPTAIYNMKKYLLLDSEPSEARSAQDKIYEWEALSGK